MKGLTSVGEWLSLVEHLVRDQGVGGSNPLSPTINNLREFPPNLIPWEGIPMNTGFEQFIRERQYLHNVSPRTIQWYREAFKWLRIPDPGERSNRRNL